MQNFNKVWREQNEKFYLKSLDHQGHLFKQADMRNIRSKSLFNEIETLFDERHEQAENNGSADTPCGPHLTLEYQDYSILEDVNNLLIHHVKRQTGIQKDDKHKIKMLLRHFILDFFKHPRQEMSEDEREDDDEDGKENEEDNSDDKDNNSKATRSERARKKKEEKDRKQEMGNHKKKEKEITEADVKVEIKDGRRTPLHARGYEADETYSHIMGNNNWYLFFRLHHVLCERMTKMYNQAVEIADSEAKDKKSKKKDSTAIALKLKPKSK